jgi:hypothetical protein
MPVYETTAIPFLLMLVSTVAGEGKPNKPTI